jgi:GcrA cell cycle regulator
LSAERNHTQVEAKPMTVIETQTTWTIERVALLKKRIDAGLSLGQIAREIGVSRNAVIGKANRLGLSRFKRATVRQPERNGTPVIARPKMARPVILFRPRSFRATPPKPQLALAGAPADSANRRSLFELQQWHCRWPISEPGAEDFGFCGSARVDCLPYCAAHSRMAYRRGNLGRRARA